MIKAASEKVGVQPERDPVTEEIRRANPAPIREPYPFLSTGACFAMAAACVDADRVLDKVAALAADTDATLRRIEGLWAK